LHIMLRFDLELQLLDGSLRVKDLPEAWRAQMSAKLGLVPPDDRDGCLQDVHWYSGGVGGAFQSYTIGNILSAQLYAAACESHPQIRGEIEVGEFCTLHDWLKKRAGMSLCSGASHTIEAPKASATINPASCGKISRGTSTTVAKNSR